MNITLNHAINRVPTMNYKGYDIFILAFPRIDGSWSASSEVQKDGALGLEVDQQFGGPFKARGEIEAKLAALRDAKMRIDAILAEVT